MIETHNLGKTFRPPPWPLSALGQPGVRTVRALHAVTVRVDRGEIFGLVGPNGAGKTTFLKILSTLLLPSEGRAWVNGVELARDAGSVKRAIGLATGEERGFYWRLSGRENLEFFAGVQGFAPRAARDKATTLLELVDLLPMARDPVARYSTGMHQRLGLARAMLGNPPVLLLDEPTRSLDPTAAHGVRSLVQRVVREEGTTVVMTTHNLEEAERMCHRVAILIGGTIREVLTDGLAGRYHALLGAGP